jgi:peptidoglycan/xylan/chitin deacetylase (PgdA/CDA1 family)
MIPGRNWLRFSGACFRSKRSIVFMRKRVLFALIIFFTANTLSIISKAQDNSSKNSVHREVAVTFDDLPQAGPQFAADRLKEMTGKLLKSIVSNDVPAIGFVNEKRLHKENELEARTAILQMWLDAGVELGNHTYSHSYFFKMPLTEFQEDVIRGETITKTLLSKKSKQLQYFRHPYLNTGPNLETKAAFEKFLAARGYKVAPVTIDNMEWIFADTYTNALQKGDTETMKRVANEYIPYMEKMFEFYEKLSMDLLGREIPQILLIHANALNADHFDELVGMMKKRGYKFISLNKALEDKAYQLPDTYTGPVGISWLQRWAITKGKEFRKEPYLPEYMRQFDNPRASGSNFKSLTN